MGFTECTRSFWCFMIGGHCDCLGGMDAPLAAALSSYLVMNARGLLKVRGSLSNVNPMIRLSVATLLHEKNSHRDVVQQLCLHTDAESIT